MPQSQSVPHSMEAEMAVLGCMINASSAMALSIESLTEADFYSSVHREVFITLTEMHNGGVPVDFVTLCDALERRGMLKGVGGVEHISEISLSVPSTANLREYIDIVVEKSTLRHLVAAGNDIIKDALQSPDPASQILERAQKSIYDISMRKNADSLRHIKGALEHSYQSISEMMERQGGLTGRPCGFADLDRMLSGLNNSDLIVLAARPSVGKTSLALNIARNFSIQNKIPSAIFSLEMSRDQLALRLLCSEARVSMQRVRSGDINETEIMNLSRAMQPLSLSQIFVDDTPGVTVADIRSKCRRLQMERGLGLVVIDYLQLMDTSSRHDNREQEVAETTRSLKILARELNVPLMLLAQLNRNAERRDKPALADLRESGAIEQDADIVLFLHRANKEEPQSDNIITVEIAKHRNGPTGPVQLAWHGEYTLFMSLDQRHQGMEPPPQQHIPAPF